MYLERMSIFKLFLTKLFHCLYSSLCFVFSIDLSNVSINAGKTVTEQITPRTTPFAITSPISRPSVKFIVHKAANPAIVVKELPEIESIVALIADAIASCLLSYLGISSLKILSNPLLLQAEVQLLMLL